MIFRKFAKWIRGQSTIEDYIENELMNLIDDLNTGLYRLRFDDNFESKIYLDQVIPASSVKTFSHQLRVVPRGRIILKINHASGVSVNLIDEDYTENSISIRNLSSIPVTISFVILK